ncbi:efflux RND transporter permease subunit [Vibrio hannami]|uniref:efflux RND transporter permease subunit n=1 Tax=Vibrio hannami TaxID=2717094 RepID=UPI0024103CEC|nr:efflux RND transporter permease subunit [Vibrio hannami]MDG3086500.1 efflux RND transporter permease subunit [Vibrio hannami]
MFKFFVKRPKFAVVISILITLVGVLAAMQSPIGRYPDVSPVTIEVYTWMDGASAEVVAKSVAPVIEQRVNGTPGMEYMKSTNNSDGSYYLQVVFNNSVDPDRAATLVKNRVDLAMPELPSSVVTNGVTVEKFTSGMVMAVAVTDESGQASELEINSFSGGQLKEALQRINGVSKVQIVGEKKYAMRVWTDPVKMAKYRVNIDDIGYAITAQNKIAGAGRIVGDKLEYSLSVDGGLSEKAQFENIVIRNASLSRKILLKDVARVELGSEAYVANAYVDSGKGSLIFIYRTPDANAMDVGSQVKDLISNIDTQFKVEPVYDTTEFVAGAIHTVVETLVLAVAIVSMVTLVFMQSIRLTLITVTAIPVSLVGTFAFMQAFGIDINIISMFGLVMAIGIVVDAAIIVIENAEVKLHDDPNISIEDAIIEAGDVVVSPIVASALVLLAVFAPTVFMDGMTGIIFGQFGIVLCSSVVVSTVVALTLTPALCALFMKREKKGVLARSIEKLISFKIGGFTMLTKGAVRLPILSIALLGGLLYLTAQEGQQLSQGMLPEEDTNGVFVIASFPPGTSLPVTDAAFKELSDEVMQLEGVKNVIGASGFNLLTSSPEMNSLMMVATMSPMTERNVSDAQLAEQINGILATKTEQGLFGFAFKPPVIPELGTVNGVSLTINDSLSRSPAELAVLVGGILEKLNASDDINMAYTQFNVDKPALKLNLDRLALDKYGADYSSVITGLQTFMGGMYINTFNMNGRNYKVMLQNDPSFRKNQEALGELNFVQGNGRTIPATKVLTIEEISVPSFLDRFNAIQSVGIDAIPSVSSGDAIRFIQNMDLPEGISIEFTGTALEEIKAGNQVVVVFSLALLICFLVLVAQYESWLIPTVIMLTVPTAVTGIVGGVMWLGGDINMLTQLSAVLLIGMTVRNAILIVEFAKTLREQKGLSIKDSAVEALRQRARAVFMTAFSFGVGLVPLMLANGVGSGGQQALGFASFGGIVTATFIGCIFACVFFVVIQQLRELGKAKPAV